MATKIYLPNLLEFIYNSIVGKGYNHLLHLLDREDYRKVKNETKARKFAEFANLEDKIIMMSKLGMGCAVVFWDKEKEKKTKVEDVVIAYVDTDPKDLTKLLVKDRVFAFRDIDIIKSLQTMSRSCMSTVYSINRKFLQIKENALKSRTLVNKLEAERNLTWYSQTVFFALDIEAVLEGFKIDTLKFKLLVYLNTLQNGATKDNICRMLNRTNVTGMLNEMYKSNMIELSGENKNVVTIDVYGIIILEQIFAKFP